MGRPRTFDRVKVLHDAVEVFRDRGYDATSVPDLVDRLGICRQSLYSEFGDKRGLYLEALEHWGRKEIDAKVALLAAPGSPLENVRTVVRGWANYATACPSDGCLTTKAIIESRGDADALAVVEGQVASLEEGFRDTLERAREIGELRPDIHPERLARMLLVSAHGIGVLSRLPLSGPRVADAVSTLLALLDDAAV
ncbi:MAG: TetR/AcrR family transcriptional repressor of nem operon [Planctomycetota bacterium]|jgi:TetR/AcrR family transcriptional repressor of nem operon